LLRRLRREDTAYEEYSKFVGCVAETSTLDSSEKYYLLDILIVSCLRKGFEQKQTNLLLTGMNSLADMRERVKKYLLLPPQTELVFNNYSINEETIFFYTVKGIEEYNFWESLLPGIYMVADSADAPQMINLSYWKHRTLLNHYASIENSVASIKHLSLFSSVSQKFLPAEECFLEFLTLENLIHETESPLHTVLQKEWQRFRQCFFSEFETPDKTISDVYSLLRETNDLSDCVKAEILLALTGNKVSRITIPKFLADNLHALWGRIGPRCCASSYLVETKNEGLGAFSNIPAGFTPYVNGKNTLTNDLIFIYVASTAHHASVCAKLDAADEAGKMLGIPTCCIEFYQKSKSDTTHLDPFSLKTNSKTDLTLPWQLNFYSMYTGSGLLWHFPCKNDCRNTISLIEERYQLIKRIDASFAEMLRMNHLKTVYLRDQQFLGHAKPEDGQLLTTINWK